MPSVTGNEAKPLAELAGETGFDSPAQAAAAVQVVKQRVQGLLREVVAESVHDVNEVDAELAEIRRYLSGG